MIVIGFDTADKLDSDDELDTTGDLSADDELDTTDEVDELESGTTLDPISSLLAEHDPTRATSAARKSMRHLGLMEADYSRVDQSLR